MYGAISTNFSLIILLVVDEVLPIGLGLGQLSLGLGLGFDPLSLGLGLILVFQIKSWS